MAKEQSTGLIFRGDTVEWTTVSGTGGRAMVVDRGCCELPSITGEGDEELAAAREARAEALRSQCGKLRSPVSMALSSEHVLLRSVELPAVSPDELQDMVELQIDKVSPFPAESMAASYEIIEKEENSLRLLIGAARIDSIEEVAAELQGAGIRIGRVDAAILGYWKLLRDSGEIPEHGRHLLLFLDGTVPEIMVLQDGVPVSIRSLGECRDLDASALAAEMALEVRYTLMSLELEHGAGEPGSMTAWYRGELPPGMETALAAESATPVNLRALDEFPPLSEGIARRLAERVEGDMDLTPPEWTRSSRHRRNRRKAITMVVSIAALWLVCVGAFSGWMSFERHRLAVLAKQRDAWRQPALDVRAMRRRMGSIKRYMSTTHSALECLREISLLLPAQVDLMSIIYHKSEGVKISGEAVNVNLVYDFKKKLDGSSLFLEGALQGPRFDRRTRKQIFDIDMKLPGGDS